MLTRFSPSRPHRVRRSRSSRRRPSSTTITAPRARRISASARLSSAAALCWRLAVGDSAVAASPCSPCAGGEGEPRGPACSDHQIHVFREASVSRSWQSCGFRPPTRRAGRVLPRATSYDAIRHHPGSGTLRGPGRAAYAWALLPLIRRIPATHAPGGPGTPCRVPADPRKAPPRDSAPPRRPCRRARPAAGTPPSPAAVPAAALVSAAPATPAAAAWPCPTGCPARSSSYGLGVQPASAPDVGIPHPSPDRWPPGTSAGEEADTGDR